MDDAGASSESPTLKQAPTKLEEAQTAWLNAERDKDIHENIVQSAKENVQSAKEMHDFWIFGCTSKAPRLSLRKDFLRRNWTSSRKNEALLMEAFLNRYTGYTGYTGFTLLISHT